MEYIGFVRKRYTLRTWTVEQGLSSSKEMVLIWSWSCDTWCLAGFVVSAEFCRRIYRGKRNKHLTPESTETDFPLTIVINQDAKWVYSFCKTNVSSVCDFMGTFVSAKTNVSSVHDSRSTRMPNGYIRFHCVGIRNPVVSFPFERKPINSRLEPV